jgi:hypothetical protein
LVCAVTAHATELFWGIGLFAGVVATAALVNRFQPSHRPRLRRLVILFVLYAIALTLGFAFETAGVEKWSNVSFIAAELLQAFTLVNLAGMLAFSVVLPKVGVEPPMFACDLLVGIG